MIVILMCFSNVTSEREREQCLIFRCKLSNTVHGYVAGNSFVHKHVFGK